ncbi:MAG TPA: carbamoyltransferase C-terminal domain-containing protein, partial [Longimicrobium sp.]
MIVLGVNAPPRGWHDTAAALVIDGRVAAFAEEERFSRVKHGVQQPPHRAVAFCLRQAGISIEDVDVVAVGWNVPRLHEQDTGSPHGFDARAYLAYVLGQATPPGRGPEIVFVPHHLAHAACGLFASPFRDPAVLVVDGIGEDESVSTYAASAGGALQCMESWAPPFSLGLLYDAACKFVGLSSLEAGKLMGLSAYGRARGMEAWPLIECRGDEYRLAVDVREGATHEEVIAGWLRVFTRLSGGAEVRTGRAALHRDELAVRAAWSAQLCVEQAMQLLCASIRHRTGREELCIVGGVGLNCAANGLVPEPVFVPPVPHDAGVALGAAWHVSPPAGERTALSPYLGLDACGDGDGISAAAPGLRWQALDEEAVIERLLEGQVGGVVEGRAEVGPRALCHRSLIALPRPVARRDQVNRLKLREPWRPFAPVGLAECDGWLWEGRAHLSRYMIGAAAVTEAGAAIIPAAMHVDGTARPQVLRDETGVVGRLLLRLREGGIPPVLLNTSFNGPDEPIVNTPAEAIATFLRLGLD